MKVDVLGANCLPSAGPIDHAVVPLAGLPSASAQSKAAPPHACTSMPRCFLYQSHSALGSLALMKMPPMPVTLRIRPPMLSGVPRRWMPCGRKRCSGREFVSGLPGWPDRSTHRVEERVDVLAAEHRSGVVKYALAIVPMDGPAARFGCRGEGLPIQYGVGEGLCAIVGDRGARRRARG